MSDKTQRTFKTGDYVIYRQSGIYKITDLRSACFHSDEDKLYYVLTSVRNTQSNVFVPADPESAAARMRYPLSRQEAKELLEHAPEAICEWIEDARERGESYQKLVKSSSARQIFGVYLRLSAYRDQLAAEKKKFYASDEKVLETASRLVSEEFAFALGIDKSIVPELIRERMQAAK